MTVFCQEHKQRFRLFEFPLFEVRDSGFYTKSGRDSGLKVSAPATFNPQPAAIYPGPRGFS